MQDPGDVGGVSPLVEFVCHEFLGMLSLRICTACCARFGTCVISHMSQSLKDPRKLIITHQEQLVLIVSAPNMYNDTFSLHACQRSIVTYFMS